MHHLYSKLEVIKVSKLMQLSSPCICEIVHYHFNSKIENGQAPVTQKSTSISRTRSYENLVDVVVSGNFGQFWLDRALWRGMALDGCSTAEGLPRHCLSTENIFVSDQPLNTRYFPWYQRVTPVRWPYSARDRSLYFRVLSRLPKF